ncbi:MAG: fused MFS/spermidine synthase [Gammaproteobacteria bacterium]|nr:fused MFS/spermidine synthase [Gammaproteobacteria bacterium]MBU1967619.1 fused MFS/spermidine synthase [Gammaproteobacteria bacterium]
MSYPIDISEEGGVRFLHFGSLWIQGAMRIARPWHLELEYTREMMTSLLMREGRYFPRRVLLIGLGAASITKFLYRNFPLTKLTVVEIEPRVVAAAHQFFKLPDDPQRIEIVIDDGARFVAQSDKTWDIVMVDGFDEDARPGELDTLPFYQLCRARLNDNGIMAVNLLGRSRGYKASVERIHEAFDGRALAFPSTESGNVIALAAAGNDIRFHLDELKEHAESLKNKTGLNLLPTLTRLEQSRTCRGSVFTL